MEHIERLGRAIDRFHAVEHVARNEVKLAGAEDAFFVADPSGFLIGRLDGRPVSCISIVRYGEDAGSTITAGPGGACRIRRCILCPRSPRPWAMREIPQGQWRSATLASGVAATNVCQRRSRPTRSSRVRRACRAKLVAATGPSSRARRVLTLPATGALAITSRLQRKGAARLRDALPFCLSCRGPGIRSD